MFGLWITRWWEDLTFTFSGRVFQDFNKWFKSKLRKVRWEWTVSLCISLKSSSPQKIDKYNHKKAGWFVSLSFLNLLEEVPITWTGAGVWCRAASTLLNSVHPRTDTQSCCWAAARSRRNSNTFNFYSFTRNIIFTIRVHPARGFLSVSGDNVLSSSSTLFKQFYYRWCFDVLVDLTGNSQLLE